MQGFTVPTRGPAGPCHGLVPLSAARHSMVNAGLGVTTLGWTSPLVSRPALPSAPVKPWESGPAWAVPGRVPITAPRLCPDAPTHDTTASVTASLTAFGRAAGATARNAPSSRQPLQSHRTQLHKFHQPRHDARRR